jgi:hypothetical protein
MSENLLQPRLEHQLTKHAHDKYLEKLHNDKNYDELLKAALCMSDLYFMERIKSDWALREAANNLAELCGYDRDSC